MTHQIPEYGVRDQAVMGASSFHEACERQAWRIPDRYNMAADIVDRWADDPGRADDTAIAVLQQDGTLATTSWREVQDLTERFGQSLIELGVRPGEVVSVVLGQGLEAAVSHLATYRIGAVLCPVSQLFSGDALAWRLRHSRARVLITNPAGVAALRGLRCGLPDLRQVIVVADGPRDGAESFWALCRHERRCATADTGPDDPALLIYTSGTTGEPKGVLHGHRVALGHANVSYMYEDIRDDDILWSPNDWSWIAGIGNGLLAPWGFGIPIHSMGTGPFDAAAAASFIDTHRPTISFLPPAALRLMRQTGVDLQHPLRCAMSGGEVLSAELRSWCTAHLCRSINQGFGQTEGNDTLAVVAAWEEPPADSIGRALPGHEPVVLDLDNKPAGPGIEGELCFRTEGRPVFMLEYFENPEATAEVIRDGLIHTGDRVFVDERGYYQYVGRGDDVIKSSGYRIGPVELENVILQDPDVLECAVVGLPDPQRGQVVTAVLRLRPDTDRDALFAALTDRSRTLVGRHAYPRRFEVVEEFPKTVTGKIRRAAVRAQFS